MAVTLVTSAFVTSTTTAATYGLVTATDQGVYIFNLSLLNMKGSATADWIEIEILGALTTTATTDVIDTYTIVGAQAAEYFRTQPYVVPQSGLFGVNLRHRTFCSTGTSFLWSVFRVT